MTYYCTQILKKDFQGNKKSNFDKLLEALFQRYLKVFYLEWCLENERSLEGVFRLHAAHE